MKKLVIVESPSKSKTIEKYLGKDYQVVSSKGHIRDLATSGKGGLGIDVEHDFKPTYVINPDKKAVVKDLKDKVKKADEVYLSTDPDREGEAIAWHLAQELDLDLNEKNRVVFNEITKDAVREAFNDPKTVDMNLVHSQETRRMLDRIIGFRLSTLLQSKIKSKSAGRVQSVALKLVCDREKEIEAFVPVEYWTLHAHFSRDNRKVEAELSKINGKKAEVATSEEANAIIEECGRDFIVSNVTEKVTRRNARLPFITSTLQQEASTKLNFSARKTMQVAQQLYEDGRITYLRTDSIRIADEAIAAAKSFVTEHYGADYYKVYEIPKKKSTKNIQDAHEAIRPSDLSFTPVLAKSGLSRDQARLYTLIYNRFLASQMQPATYDVITARFSVAGYEFRQTESATAFDGFTRIYTEADDEKEPVYGLAGIEVGEKLALSELLEKQHFTQAPPRFTEASLVRTLEELSIGRPSTYSPIITTLLKRHYIGKDGRAIFVTELGDVVNNIMKESFPTIVDLTFTANMEEKLDEVEEGELPWKDVVRDFYPDLAKSIEKAEKELEKVKIEDEVTDIICEKCGRNMVVKYGPHGKFLACPGFPECRNTKPYLEKIGASCPKCGKDIVLRKTKKGRVFYGCEDYPDCDFMSWQRPAKKACPRCKGFMVYKGKKLACADPACGYTENVSSED